jgi:RimJ/RimL family protein N-acetyltransferase
VIAAGNLNHAKSIAEEVGVFFNPACDHVISRARSGRLLGGVIFTGYTTKSIAIHVAGFDKHWINSDMLWITFDYPFNQLGVTKLIGHVPSSNPKALDFNRKLGFKEEARVADVYPDGDLVILSMHRDNCRWLKLRPRSSKGLLDG